MRSLSDSAKPQEQELWEQLGTSNGADKAKVLDELSHIAFSRNSYMECLQLVDTSIEIYFSLGLELHTRDLIHVTQGKAACLVNLNRPVEAAEAFENLANLHELCDDIPGYVAAMRSAACNWYEAEEWQKSLDGHNAVKDAIDPEATPMSMGIDLLNIGMAQAKLENFDAAVQSFINARSRFKEAKNPEHINWCDSYLARAYTSLGNGPEAKFHAQHYLNFSKVSEDIELEGFARFRLGAAHLVCSEYEEAEFELTRSLGILTSMETKDWELIIEANKELSRALVAMDRSEEAELRLEALKTIEETFL